MADRLLDALTQYIARVRANRRLEYGILPGATADRVLLGTTSSGATTVHGASTYHTDVCAGYATGPARRDTMLSQAGPCDGRMIRLSHDVNNCGRVGAECDPGEICLAGVCRPGRTRF